MYKLISVLFFFLSATALAQGEFVSIRLDLTKDGSPYNNPEVKVFGAAIGSQSDGLIEVPLVGFQVIPMGGGKTMFRFPAPMVQNLSEINFLVTDACLLLTAAKLTNGGWPPILAGAGVSGTCPDRVEFPDPNNAAATTVTHTMASKGGTRTTFTSSSYPISDGEVGKKEQLDAAIRSILDQLGLDGNAFCNQPCPATAGSAHGNECMMSKFFSSDGGDYINNTPNSTPSGPEVGWQLSNGRENFKIDVLPLPSGANPGTTVAFRGAVYCSCRAKSYAH